MGGRGSGGRNAVPKALHVVRGSYRRDRHGQSPDASPLVDVPAAPEWLDEVARGEWDRVAADLVQLGVLTELDVTALAAYCAAVSTWRSASATVTTEGVTVQSARGGRTTHPAVRIARNAEQQMLRWAAEFGLTPASRGRPGVAMPPEARGNDPGRLLSGGGA